MRLNNIYTRDDLLTFTLHALSLEPEPEGSKSKPARAQKILRHQSPSLIPKLRDRQGIFQSRIETKGRQKGYVFRMTEWKVKPVPNEDLLCCFIQICIYITYTYIL